MHRTEIATLLAAYRWGHLTLPQLCRKTRLTPAQLRKRFGL